MLIFQTFFVWLLVFSGVSSREEDYHFLPKLSFTESGVSQRSGVTLHLKRPPPLGSNWAGQGRQNCQESNTAPCVWAIKASENVRFTIRHFFSLAEKFNCMKGPDLLVWFRSVEGHVVFSAPALPDENCMPGELAVNFKAHDTGVYDVTLVVADTKTFAAGAHGTEARIVPIGGGPWRLWVRNPGDNLSDKTPPAQQFRLPNQMCTAVDNPTGRWVKCSAANVHSSNCLRDGWVFFPDDCRYNVLHPSAILRRVKKARPMITKPLWVVVLGSSIERGTLHAMVDLVGGVQFDPAKKEHLRTELFGSATKAEPGRGSPLKCWGWFDVQVGHLRMSYSDFRTPYMQAQSEYGDQSFKRLKEIIDEGPDVIVFGHSGGPISYLAKRAVDLVAASPNWHGSLIFSVGKQRFLSGGIRASHCLPLGRPPYSDAVAAKYEISNAVKQCGERCKSFIDERRVVVGDELLMAWAFVFDMERPMFEKQASQHFHYYRRGGVPRYDPTLSGICNKEDKDGRGVYGAVPEMAAQMYLAHALSLVPHSQQVDGENVVDYDTICEHRHDELSAPFIPAVICADCPEEACCPWVPAASHPFSVATAHDHTLVPELSLLNMKSCYISPSAGRQGKGLDGRNNHLKAGIPEFMKLEVKQQGVSYPTSRIPVRTSVLHHASECHALCGGITGACPDFCGPLGACCRLGFQSNTDGDIACHHGKIGCNENEHCCVQKSASQKKLLV